jgi:hypothetical protein
MFMMYETTKGVYHSKEQYSNAKRSKFSCISKHIRNRNTVWSCRRKIEVATWLSDSFEYSPQYGIFLCVIDADPSIAKGKMELKKREITKRLQKEGLLSLNPWFLLIKELGRSRFGVADVVQLKKRFICGRS